MSVHLETVKANSNTATSNTQLGLQVCFWYTVIGVWKKAHTVQAKTYIYKYKQPVPYNCYCGKPLQFAATKISSNASPTLQKKNHLSGLCTERQMCIASWKHSPEKLKYQYVAGFQIPVW